MRGDFEGGKHFRNTLEFLTIFSARASKQPSSRSVGVWNVLVDYLSLFKPWELRGWLESVAGLMIPNYTEQVAG